MGFLASAHLIQGWKASWLFWLLKRQQGLSACPHPASKRQQHLELVSAPFCAGILESDGPLPSRLVPGFGFISCQLSSPFWFCLSLSFPFFSFVSIFSSFSLCTSHLDFCLFFLTFSSSLYASCVCFIYVFVCFSNLTSIWTLHLDSDMGQELVNCEKSPQSILSSTYIFSPSFDYASSSVEKTLSSTLLHSTHSPIHLRPYSKDFSCEKKT